MSCIGFNSAGRHKITRAQGNDFFQGTVKFSTQDDVQHCQTTPPAGSGRFAKPAGYRTVRRCVSCSCLDTATVRHHAAAGQPALRRFLGVGPPEAARQLLAVASLTPSVASSVGSVPAVAGSQICLYGKLLERLRWARLPALIFHAP
eukprot:SAG11_NODE_2019_length_3914_cov_2.546908_2_plen_147_part_00